MSYHFHSSLYRITKAVRIQLHHFWVSKKRLSYFSAVELLSERSIRRVSIYPVFRIRIRIQSGQWIRIRIRIRNPDPGGQKLPTKIDGCSECSLLRTEGFFCSLDVLYFWSSKPWIRIGIQPKMLDPDLDQKNTDPTHCIYQCTIRRV